MLESATPTATGSAKRTRATAPKAALERAKRKRTTATSDPATFYAERVLEERIIAGPYVRQACARHIDDLEVGHHRGLIWRPRDEGDRALQFFPRVLRLNGGQFEGKPFELLGFQSFIVGSIFGWLRAETMTRRFRTAYVEMGKGNGKSPLAGGIGLYGLTSDNEARAEVYAAATKKDQAMILFRDAVAMVDQSPELKHRLTKTPADSAKTAHLGYPARGSFFKAIASEDKQSGPRPHIFLVDELHEHPDATIVSMAAAGQKFRRQPLTFEITNSGFDRTTVCYRHHQYSIRVVSREREDDEWFAYVCANDKGDDPLEHERCWIKTNPGLGHIIQKSYLRTQRTQALGMPAEASRVRRLNFCEWVDAENPWIDGALWRTAERPGMDGIAELQGCARVCAGLDLSGANDLTALALTGEGADGRTKARVEFWTPGDTLRERSAKDLVTYDLWVEQGFMTATPGRAVDYAFVAQRLIELETLLPQLEEIAFDRYRIKYLEVELDRLGSRLKLVPHPQGYYKAAPKKLEDGTEAPQLWMPRSIELLTEDVSKKRIDIEANPALTHNSASAVLLPDEKNNFIFTKRKSRGRIDGLVALAMADGLLKLEAAPTEDLDDFINSPLVG